MGEIRSLYEERKIAEVAALCQKELDAGNADFEVYAYMACAQAARNNLSRLSLEEAMAMFSKAAETADGNAQAASELYDSFVKEILGSLEKTDEMFAGVAMTADTVQAYRDCMKSGAEALLMAAAFGESAVHADTLDVKKRAASCMVKLCAVYYFEQDLGKVKVKKVGNAPDDIRETYTEKYDELVSKIQEKDTSYVPEEIQRERIDAEHPQKKPEENMEDGKPKKKSLIDKLLDFF